MVLKLRAEGYTVEQEVQSGTTKQIVILDGETEITDNGNVSVEKDTTKVLNIDVQSVSSNGQVLPYYMLVSGRYHKILEDDKGNLSLEETETPENTVKGITDNSATYALNLVSSDTESTNAKVTLNDGKITIVGNKKTTEDIEIVVKYTNLQNSSDVKATKKIKIKITKSAINYGIGKTATTVVQGDTIEITFGTGAEEYTEQFMVLSNNGSKIMAMPYYNITLDTTNPVQASSGTGALAFSGSGYWSESAGVNINMSGANNVQQYISAYSSKLSTTTNGRATAEIGRYYDDEISTGWNISSYSGQKSGGKKLLNPSGTGYFWLGSANSSNTVHCVSSIGQTDYNTFHINYKYGVRPVIKISLE